MKTILVRHKSGIHFCHTDDLIIKNLISEAGINTWSSKHKDQPNLWRLYLRLRMQSMLVLLHTCPVPWMGCWRSSLYIPGFEAHSAFISMTLQKRTSLQNDSLKFHDFMPASLFSLGYLSLPSRRKPYASSSTKTAKTTCMMTYWVNNTGRL